MRSAPKRQLSDEDTTDESTQSSVSAKDIQSVKSNDITNNPKSSGLEVARSKGKGKEVGTEEKAKGSEAASDKTLDHSPERYTAAQVADEIAAIQRERADKAERAEKAAEAERKVAQAGRNARSRALRMAEEFGQTSEGQPSGEGQSGSEDQPSGESQLGSETPSSSDIGSSVEKVDPDVCLDPWSDPNDSDLDEGPDLLPTPNPPKPRKRGLSRLLKKVGGPSK